MEVLTSTEKIEQYRKYMLRFVEYGVTDEKVDRLITHMQESRTIQVNVIRTLLGVEYAIAKRIKNKGILLDILKPYYSFWRIDL